jgi:hypothetical protein
MNRKFHYILFSLIFFFIFLFLSVSGARAVETNFSLTIETPTPTPTPTSAGDGGGGGGGAASAPVCNDTKPGSAPTLLSASAGTNSVTLTWSKAQDPATYYLATYSTISGSQQYGNPNVGGHDTTSYTVSGLSGGITYYFKVRAGNGCMPGDFSNELPATPGGGFIGGPAQGFAPGVPGKTAGGTPLFDISLGSAVGGKSKFPLLPAVAGVGIVVTPSGIFIAKYLRYKKKMENEL